MKNIFLFIAIIISNFNFAQNTTIISQNDILLAANNFIKFHQNYNYEKKGVHKTDEIQINKITGIEADKKTIAYVARLTPKGYIVFSAERNIAPVICYSYENNFLYDNSNENIFLSMIRYDIGLRQKFLRTNSPEAKDLSMKNEKLWSEYLNGKYKFKGVMNSYVEPMIKSNWHQGDPYNNHVPTLKTNLSRYPVGCVNVAIGQILNYYKLPKSIKLDEQDSYITTTEGIKIPDDHNIRNFPTFDLINDSLSNIKYNNKNEEIGYLLFALGIITKTDYVWENGIRESGANATENTFERLGYNATGTYLIYSLENILKSLSQGHLVYLEIKYLDVNPAKIRGHAVIVNGYDGAGAVYINMGWGGDYDTWYVLPNILDYNFIFYNAVDIYPKNVPPEKPTLISPDEGVTIANTSVNLQWLCTDLNKEDILAYDVYFGDELNFYAINKKQAASNLFVPGLQRGKQYFWQILASDGVEYSISDKRSFWTSSDDINLDAPSLQIPCDDSVLTTTNPFFEWSDIQNSTAYQIMIDNNSDFSSPEVFEDVSSNQFNLDKFLAYGTYYWKVRTIVSTFQSSWSIPFRFSIINNNEYSISGYVKTINGGIIPDVELQFSNGTSTKTDYNGYYIKSLPKEWVGSVIPKKEGFSFIPTQMDYSLKQNEYDQNFIGNDDNDALKLIKNISSSGLLGELNSIYANGNYLIVGRPAAGDVLHSGEVDIYIKNNNEWNLQQKLKPDNPIENLRFGRGVSISGENVAVSDSKNTVYLFKNINNMWVEYQNLNVPYGRTVALYKNLLAVGGVLGRVYLFELKGQFWEKLLELTFHVDIQIGNEGNIFSLALNDKYIVVGTPLNGPNGKGTVEVFCKQDNDWVEISGPQVDESLRIGFGYSIDLFGNNIVVGSGKGAYLFKIQNNECSLVQQIGTDEHRSIVSFVGNYIVIGSFFNPEIIQSERFRGIIRVFELKYDNWIEKEKIVASDDNAAVIQSGQIVGYIIRDVAPIIAGDNIFISRAINGSGIYGFKKKVNYPPTKPIINMIDSVISVNSVDSNSLMVNWLCEDLDRGSLFYDLYFNFDDHFEKIAEDIDSLHYSIKGLVADKYYKLYVVAKDESAMNFSDTCKFILRDTLTNFHDSLENSIPTNYSVYQNYPNPFNPTTEIMYQLPEQSYISLKIYNIIGEEIAILSNEVQPAGKYEKEFNAKSLSSGVYFYVLSAQSLVSDKTFRKTGKMLLLK